MLKFCLTDENGSKLRFSKVGLVLISFGLILCVLKDFFAFEKFPFD